MGKLTEWCTTQPAWAVDALQRAASVDEITDAEINAVRCRVAIKHGLAVEGEHPCKVFSESALAPSDPIGDDVLLGSIGPLEGVDRIIGDQQLKFAQDGVTVIFGDNASGKSGYARAARRLCHARVPIDLQGDVFATDGEPNPRRITYSYQRPGESLTTETWNDGDEPPQALAAITVLDTDNARVYVESGNEILFLPPEVNCLTRLGKLYTGASATFQAEAEALERAHSTPFGNLYDATTPAGCLVSKLTTATAHANLPTEEQMLGAAIWDEARNTELTALEAQLAERPAIVAAKYNRLANDTDSAAIALRNTLAVIDDDAIANDQALLVEKRRTQQIADALAAEQIGGQLIAATGSDPWKELYQYARKFAAEAGIRRPDEPFEAGDACPLCQRQLDEGAAKRLASFDAFMEGKASADARNAAAAVGARTEALERLVFRTRAELEQLLAEYVTLGPDAEALRDRAIAFNEAARARRDLIVAGLMVEALQPFPPLPTSPVGDLIAGSADLRRSAEALLQGGGDDSPAVARAKELRDQKRLHDQLDEALARRSALDRRHRNNACVAALNTSPVSRLATTLRKELVTPELSKRIEEELDELALGHIPLKFTETTARGASFFEVALATDQRADKRRVLSEGEQQALSIACFLAESHVAGRKSAIILDDPVTSLGHRRLRRVAKRLVREAAQGRQIIVFTHNMLFYQEMLRACAVSDPQVPALPCLIRQAGEKSFGLVTNDDQPWVAKKIKDRERHLEEMLRTIPGEMPTDSDEFRQRSKSFYPDLRESWERVIEEVLFNGVVERFGSDVKTQSLKGVEITDEDYKIIFFAMKDASEHSGHDRAAARQIDVPSKDRMRAALDELRAFRASRQKRRDNLQDARKALERAPVASTT